jgi:hypothetical protein
MLGRRPWRKKGAVARIYFSKCGQGVWSWSVVTKPSSGIRPWRGRQRCDLMVRFKFELQLALRLTERWRRSAHRAGTQAVRAACFPRWNSALPVGREHLRPSMYVFGIAVACNDQSRFGRASAALRERLPALFPEHRFEFLTVENMPAAKLEELLFHVLGAPLDRSEDEGPSPELVERVQAAVDDIVAMASARSVN